MSALYPILLFPGSTLNKSASKELGRGRSILFCFVRLVPNLTKAGGVSKKITVLLRPQVAQMGTAGEERQAKEWEEERERERKDDPL